MGGKHQWATRRKQDGVAIRGVELRINMDGGKQTPPPMTSPEKKMSSRKQDFQRVNRISGCQVPCDEAKEKSYIFQNFIRFYRIPFKLDKSLQDGKQLVTAHRQVPSSTHRERQLQRLTRINPQTQIKTGSGPQELYLARII